MKDLKRALLDRALVVLPIGAIVLLVLGIVRKLQNAADPLAGRFVHPAVVAVVALVLLCLVVGLLVRPAAAALAFAMLVAIFSVHIGNGLFMKDNGYEFGLALLAVSVSLAISGAGRLSVDRVLAGSAR